MSNQVVVLGDSVTHGMGFSGVTESTRFVSLLQRDLQEAGVDVDLTPSALDGADTGYVLKRFDRMVARLQPDMLIVALGLNDARPPGNRDACSPNCFAKNLAELTERAMEIDARPILATPSPRIDVMKGRLSFATMKPYAERVRRVADHYQLPVIDVFQRLTAQSDLETLIPDRLHPSPAAHELIADQFARTLMPLLGAGDPRRSSAPAAAWS